MKTYFVVRDTNHPKEDLERNWSSYAGGSEGGESGGTDEEDARTNYADVHGWDAAFIAVFRYHPAYDEYVVVHYEGLGAWALESDNLEDAIQEAMQSEEFLASTFEAGDGHFYAEDVVSYHQVKPGRFVFELKY